MSRIHIHTMVTGVRVQLKLLTTEVKIEIHYTKKFIIFEVMPQHPYTRIKAHGPVFDKKT